MFFDSQASQFDAHGLTGIPARSAMGAMLYDIPDGPDGTKITLRLMRGLVRDAIREPSGLIQNLADEIIQRTGISPGNSKNYAGIARVLHAFVRDDIRYVRDPDDVEVIRTPFQTLERQSGDCDDKSTLLAALLKSVGHPCRFWAVGFDGDGQFSHVLVETLIGNEWVACETILDVEMGWRPRGVTSSYTLNL